MGTNDLTQYTMAVDRGNARLADRFTPHHLDRAPAPHGWPRSGTAAGMPVSVCGEMASEPLSAVLLIGLGYDRLSVAPPALPAGQMGGAHGAGGGGSRGPPTSRSPPASAAEVSAALRETVGEFIDVRLLDPSSALPGRGRVGSLRPQSGGRSRGSGSVAAPPRRPVSPSTYTERTYGSPKRHVFTSESVTEGHPDKVADQISDAVLDAILARDPAGRVACETLVTTGMAVVAGEITTTTYVHIPDLVRETVESIGYTDAAYGFDGRTCAVLTSIDRQSPDIAMGVERARPRSRAPATRA